MTLYLNDLIAAQPDNGLGSHSRPMIRTELEPQTARYNETEQPRVEPPDPDEEAFWRMFDGTSSGWGL